MAKKAAKPKAPPPNADVEKGDTAKETANKKGRQVPLTNYMKTFEVKTAQASTATLGLMLGVYLPSIQNVFGVIMFLRLSWMVGLMGIYEAFSMVFLCCLCTFLTTLSISAICTNGFIGRGGPYFLISRSLGAAVGSAVGLLFCLANTVAVGMYVIGGVEILLMYLAPTITLGGKENLDKTDFLGMMTNSQRVYGIGFLLITFLIVVAGVRITQKIAPFSLLAVILSILAIYAGSIHKAATDDTGVYICVLEGRTLKLDTFMPPDSDMTSTMDKMKTCAHCVVATNDSNLPIWKSYCKLKNSTDTNDQNGAGSCALDVSRTDMNGTEWLCRNIYRPEAAIQCKRGTTGYNITVMKTNLKNNYYRMGKALPIDANKDSSSDQKDREACKSFHTEDAKVEAYQDMASSFFLMLAIYFPSVTGIATGANMSGDLKDPQKSIPWGTLAAQLTTSFVYLTYVVLFGSCIDRNLLVDKYGHSLGGNLSTAALAWPHPMVVLIGTLLSTFGAGIQSLCSAPRLLQSIAQDDVIPCLRVLGRLSRFNEPLMAQLFISTLALVFTLIGKVDVVAPFVQICFLCSYAGLNLSCFMSSIVRSPSWRPRFKLYHPMLSLFGFLLSLFLMFSSGHVPTESCAVVTVLMGLMIHLYVTFRGNRKEFGDSIGGLQLSVATSFLFVPRSYPDSFCAWQPRLLVVNYEQMARSTLGAVASYLQSSANTLTIHLSIYKSTPKQKSAETTKNETDVKVSEKQVNADVSLRTVNRQNEEDTTGHIKLLQLKAFVKSAYSQNSTNSMAHRAYATLLRFTQLGKLKPNTVLMSYSAELESSRSELALAALHGPNTIVVTKFKADRLPALDDSPQKGSIHVWWILEHGGALLKLAVLVQTKAVWRQCSLHLHVVLVKGKDNQSIQQNITQLLQHSPFKVHFHDLPIECLRPFVWGLAKRRVDRLRLFKTQQITKKMAEKSAQTLFDLKYECKVPASISEYGLSAQYEQSGAQSLNELVVSVSGQANMVLMGLPGAVPQQAGLVRAYVRFVGASIQRLPAVLLVRAAPDHPI